MVENRKNNETKGLTDKERREWSERVKRYEAEPKTKRYQRLQAISRHPEYIREY
ncbi:MAG: hypothetical protein GY941_19105 [Planctomycetes bacterium]|nr:hypothetical protein [Planctomycetota bacterium]